MKMRRNITHMQEIEMINNVRNNYLADSMFMPFTPTHQTNYSFVLLAPLSHCAPCKCLVVMGRYHR